MDAQADATELAPKKSAHHNPPGALHKAREGCSLQWRNLASVADASVTTHFLGEASERRPWAFNRDDRPAIIAGRSELSLRVPRDTGRAYTSKYPIPLPAGTRLRHVKQRGKSAGNYHENVRGKDCGSLQGA